MILTVPIIVDFAGKGEVSGATAEKTESADEDENSLPEPEQPDEPPEPPEP